ncbi:DUF2116 family Zn-ribbon domain-containing protein [Mangrovibacter yixingensis]|uniref:DUF2116 family Zn-ribbon domain-containing protein n=1 Tax=Mangrovibacter yixingensis TaxID=1529639 RepID=UPI001CFF4397|nr:DUF2116 family Zn-ribbon domain-containing protein [Mangrovibacter yixingensis]
MKNNTDKHVHVCPVCGKVITGRAKTCSQVCRNKLSKLNKAATVDISTFKCTGFYRFIRDNVKRAGTLAILHDVDLLELNSFYNTWRKMNFSCNEPLEISHYIPASQHGSLHPHNLGIWPKRLNQQFSDKTLSGLGVKVSDRTWNSSRYDLSDRKFDDVFTALFKTQIKKLISSGDLALPVRYNKWLMLKKKGYKSAYSSCDRMKLEGFNEILAKHGIAPLKPFTGSFHTLTVEQVLEHELQRQVSLNHTPLDILEEIEYGEEFTNISYGQIPDALRSYGGDTEELLCALVTHDIKKAYNIYLMILENKYDPETIYWIQNRDEYLSIDYTQFDLPL